MIGFDFLAVLNLNDRHCSPRRQDAGHFAATVRIEVDDDDESSAGVGGRHGEKILQRANAARRRTHCYDDRLVPAVAAFLIRHVLCAKLLVFVYLYPPRIRPGTCFAHSGERYLCTKRWFRRCHKVPNPWVPGTFWS